MVFIPKDKVSNEQIKIAIIASQITYREDIIFLSTTNITVHKVIQNPKKIKSLGDIFLKSKTLSSSKTFISGEQLQDNLQINYNDAVKTLQTQPGVSSSGNSIDSALFIQGGSGEEWVGIFDNIYIFTPLRWNGAVSMFNPLIINHINFYTGGFPVFYGNALSGVLDVSSLIPDKQRWRFYGNIDNGIEFLSHGPIGKKISTLVYIRRTWIDLLQTLFPEASLLSPGGASGGIVQAPYILDSLIKFNFDLNPQTTMSTFFYFSREGLDLDVNQVSARPANPNQEEGTSTQFFYEEDNFIVSLSLEHSFSSLNVLKATAGYTPRILYYRQNDNGIRGTQQPTHQSFFSI